jgi:cytochrome c peroxidase
MPTVWINLRKLGVVILAALAGCVVPQQQQPPELPAHFPKPHYEFSRNRWTTEGYALGRKLFFDPRLSRNGQVSCGSCHQPSLAYADTLRFSQGLAASLRNTPALQNLLWQPYFFADGGVTHLEFVALAPVTNHREQGLGIAEMLAILKQDPAYRQAFKQVFRRDTLDTQQVLFAFTQFLGSLVSAHSPWDAYATRQATLSPDALAGWRLFQQHCVACHPPPLFTDFSFSDIGLEAQPTDSGRARISESAQDRGKFKVPSLRNVALTPPYMHDGRYATLAEAVRHYAAGGIQPSPRLDPRLPRQGIALSEKEQQQIVRFLHSLTDTAFARKP